MRILQINSVCGRGSTGRIATDIADNLRAEGHECRIAYGRYDVPEKYRDISVRIGADWDVCLHGAQTRLFDAHGFGSRHATEKFLDWVWKYDPDVIHLHNIHGYYINIELLFDYLKTAQKTVIWTLHDCWPFTGHCSYFTVVKCEQWRIHCSYCVQKKSYPGCLLWSNSNGNFDRKRAAFTGVKNMTLITPSEWLSGIVGESFLREYPVRVIPNGIDLTVFHPTTGDFRSTRGLEGKKIALGVANVWDENKGLSDLITLSRLLNPSWQIVVVGLNKKQMKVLPSNMIGIRRTNNTRELAEIYTTADVFVNPTYQDNFPTTNLEALACGTPVVTYRTGGSPEAIDESCGIVTEHGPAFLAEALPRLKCSREACLKRAMLFERNKRFGEYIELYRAVKGGL